MPAGLDVTSSYSSGRAHPLTQRVAEVCDRAHVAERDSDLATVHNLAALLASDCGLPGPSGSGVRRSLAGMWLTTHPVVR